MAATAVATPRHPPTTPRFHRFRRVYAAPHLGMHDLLREYGDFMCWRGFIDVYLVNHPDYLRTVLARGYERFSKRTIDYLVLAQVMGNGLVSNDGPHWVKQRRLMQPMFASRNINRFDETINSLTSTMMDDWNARTGGEAFHVDREMHRLAFRIVGATLFGSDIDRHSEEVARILEVVNLRPQELRAIMTLHSWIPTPYNLKWKRAKKRLDGIVYAMIEARRRAGAVRTDGGDLLDRLLAARDEETGERMDETQMRDEVVTLLLAGHETSANALTWTLYLLDANPAVEARLAEELAARLNGAPATAADLPRIPYLKQVVQESMRLYPPVWAYARRSEHEEEFGGFVLPAKAYVGVIPGPCTGTPTSGRTRSASTRTGSKRSEARAATPTATSPSRPAPEPASAPASRCSRPSSCWPRSCSASGCGSCPGIRSMPLPRSP